MTIATTPITGGLNQGILTAHLVASSETFQQAVDAGSQLEALNHCHINQALETEFEETPPFALILEGPRTSSRSGTSTWLRGSTLDLYLEFVYSKPDTHLAWLNLQVDFSNKVGAIIADMESNAAGGQEDPLNPGFSYIDITGIETAAAPTWESIAESGAVDNPDDHIPQLLSCWQQLVLQVRG